MKKIIISVIFILFCSTANALPYTTISSNVITVDCESWSYDRNICSLIYGITEVYIYEQLSEASCDQRWSFTNASVEVWSGCRAKFLVYLDRYVDFYRMKCESKNYDRQTCDTVNLRSIGTVWINNRLSDRSCRKGTPSLFSPGGSWWYTNYGDGSSAIIRTDKGCRAEFSFFGTVMDNPGGPPVGSPGDPGEPEPENYQ